MLDVDVKKNFLFFTFFLARGATTVASVPEDCRLCRRRFGSRLAGGGLRGVREESVTKPYS